MVIKDNMPLVALCFVLLFGGGSALGSGNDGADPGSEKAAVAMESCMKKHYPGFKGGRAVQGFMPGRLEQEAICRAEFDMEDTGGARGDMGGEGNSPVKLEMRKLSLMERISRGNGEGMETAAVFREILVKNPPVKYLGIRPGVKPDQAPHLDTSGARARVPDMLRTLDSGKAPKIYYFHSTEEKLPAVCVDPKEDGSCKEIVSKKKYEQQNEKKLDGEEEGKFKKFMKKVKSSFTGPEPKETIQWKNVDFCGVSLSEVAYSFDYDFAYIGFFARIADREPFVVKKSPQYIRDVFRALIRQFGEPALKLKEPDPATPGMTDSHGIWITADGFRIDALCGISPKESGICTDGRLSVRRLPPAVSALPDGGAGFFE